MVIVFGLVGFAVWGGLRLLAVFGCFVCYYSRRVGCLLLVWFWLRRLGLLVVFGKCLVLGFACVGILVGSLLYVLIWVWRAWCLIVLF